MDNLESRIIDVCFEGAILVNIKNTKMYLKTRISQEPEQVFLLDIYS